MRLTILIGTTILGILLARTPAQAQHGHDHDDDRQSGSDREHDSKHQKEHDNGHQKDHGNSGAQHADQRREGGPEHVHQQPAHEEHHEARGRSEREEPRHDQPHPQQAHQPEHVREVGRFEHEREHEQHARRDAWEGHRATHWEHEHHSWRERGGYRGYRIPEVRFHDHFGRGRWFRVHSAPMIVVGGYPRFQYGGFWFSVVDPWPEYWARTWYETDDVYIDYVNDGYYMYNRHHPGVAIAINVSL